MPTQQQGEPSANAVKREAEHLNAIIGRGVMEALGRPGDPCRVQVRPLWEGHYRVNVLAGEDANATTRVAHSYFLVADRAGNILETTPKLTRQY